MLHICVNIYLTPNDRIHTRERTRTSAHAHNNSVSFATKYLIYHGDHKNAFESIKFGENKSNRAARNYKNKKKKIHINANDQSSSCEMFCLLFIKKKERKETNSIARMHSINEFCA